MSENDKPRKSADKSPSTGGEAYVAVRAKDQYREAQREAKGRGKVLSPDEQYIYEFFKQHGSSPDRLEMLNHRIDELNAAYKAHRDAAELAHSFRGTPEDFKKSEQATQTYQTHVPLERAVAAFRRSLTADQISQQPQKAGYDVPLLQISPEEIAQAKLVIHENSKAIRRYERHQIDAPPALPVDAKDTSILRK